MASEKLSENGKCPSCASQIKIQTDDCVIYKTRLMKVYDKGMSEIKCPSCKKFVSEFIK